MTNTVVCDSSSYPLATIVSRPYRSILSKVDVEPICSPWSHRASNNNQVASLRGGSHNSTAVQNWDKTRLHSTQTTKIHNHNRYNHSSTNPIPPSILSTKKEKQISNSKPKGSHRQSECLRRIKREWKDAVQLGIAYDWIHKETVTTLGRSPCGRNHHHHHHHPQEQKKEWSHHNTSIDIDPSFVRYNYVRLGPMGKNLLQWHFSVMGPSHSVYEQGIYHGVILLPKDYPGSPPRIQLVTPSGRFVTNKDICLSASAHHPELWTPRWTILSLIDALRIHMLSTPNEIGGMHSTSETRRKYAQASRSWPLHQYMLSVGIFSTHGEMDMDTIPSSKDLLSSPRQRSRISHQQRHSSTIKAWKIKTFRLMSFVTALIVLFLFRWI